MTPTYRDTMAAREAMAEAKEKCSCLAEDDCGEYEIAIAAAIAKAREEAEAELENVRASLKLTMLERECMCRELGIPEDTMRLAYLESARRVVCERDALKAKGERLARVVEHFCYEAERAGGAREQELRGGQQVAPQGDFAYVTPSVQGKLKWWAENLRSALAAWGSSTREK